MKNSPTFIDKNSTYISGDVSFGEGVLIYPNNHIVGKCKIGNNVKLMPNNYIENGEIQDDCTIESSHIVDAVIKSGTTVGPFARIRPYSTIGSDCKIGNFVEVKNSIIGDGTKASHLAYIGDANVGKNCNIGCGVIFANYNGRTKSKTIVGDNCFIGSNSNLIAPLKIASNTYICAGTTMTNNTKEYDFVIGRTRQIVKSKRAKDYLSDEK